MPLTPYQSQIGELMEWIVLPPDDRNYTLDQVVDLIPEEFQCDQCGNERNILSSALTQTDHGIERWCSHCARANSFRCEDCNIRTESEMAHEYHDDCCVECGEIREEERRNDDYDDENEDGINDYSDRLHVPKTLWPGYPAPNKRYFGIELEVEVRGGQNRRGKVEETKDILPMDLFMLKHDGSLNHGFEIVSAPASLDKVPDLWQEFLKSTPTGIRSERTETCGMHIHVSRNSMTPLTLGKALVFMNAASNSAFVTRVAGRDETTYCQRKNKTLKSGQVINSEDRYEILNVTPQTAEFRLFKGTLTYKTFMKNVEFTNAVVEFCAQTSMKHLKYTDFVTWMSNQSRDQYPHLKKFINEHYGIKKEKKQTNVSNHS